MSRLLQYLQNPSSHEALDLLADCKITSEASEQSEVEYAEIQEMGIWHSTPLAHRHKSKISLTWVLKENLGKSDKKSADRVKNYSNEKHKSAKDFKVGRNEYYDLRFKSACDEFNGVESFSDTSVGTEEYVRRKHRHKHRRRKRNSKFGYDIRDLDSFLSEVIYILYIVNTLFLCICTYV